MQHLNRRRWQRAPMESQQPITLEAGQRAKLDKAIEAACMEYFKAEKGEK